ncbi:hypothetical protein GCM10011395_25950 [Sphingomonas psychrolutea]|uniref:Uncharacterized protein n=1 Tax=Sphingomonas psychrolutea TaxID=1259676 RepID=A0ABQ1H084_9SPHN|nr:hypothetical protein GCM10011395_25950 [Sphingomonas psychrolutea]
MTGRWAQCWARAVVRWPAARSSGMGAGKGTGAALSAPALAKASSAPTGRRVALASPSDGGFADRR